MNNERLPNPKDGKTKNLFRFLEWQVYKDAREFRKKVKQEIKVHFPPEEKYRLAGQIERALSSICLNIAEGSNKLSDIELSRYLNNASGSLEEVVSGLDLARNDGYISNDIFNALVKDAENIGRQLIAFGKSARNNGKTKQ